MNPIRWFNQLTSSVRVLLIVILLMATVSAVLSERVLNRLYQNQQTYLEDLAGSYLDGLAASVSPSVLRRDSWEIYDTLLRMKPSKASVLPRESVVTDASNVTLASDDPVRHPTLTPLTDEFLAEFENETVQLNSNSELAYKRKTIKHRGQIIGKVYVVFDASSLLQERRRVLLALLLTNGILTLILAGIGFLAVRKIVRPVHILESHLQAAASGGLEPISDAESGNTSVDAKRMFAAFNKLVDAEQERERLIERLTREDRLASLGRLASGVAHEINNPLGGLLNATDTLAKHGHRKEVRSETIDLIRRGLLGLRDVAQAMLATYRPERASRMFTRQDLNDMELLVRQEFKARSQRLEINAPSSDGTFGDLPAGSLRQAILNLVMNASQASPDGSTIVLNLDRVKSALRISIHDEGQGMPNSVLEMINSPLASVSLERSSGLGLWVVKQIADELNATLSVEQGQPHGTVIIFTIPTKEVEGIDVAA